jgi:transposase-like protein
MGINKVQFQKGLSMTKFMERVGPEERCHAALVKSRWPTGFVCPGCGSSRHCTFERKELQYWQCSACREQTTATCGTIFQATKLPLTTWFPAMHLLTQAKNNVSGLELMRHLGVGYKTACKLLHKLMQVMSEREEPRQLDGRVEIDDAYLGGELPGGKSGRGSENKVSFIAAVQTTETGQPLRVCLSKLEFPRTPSPSGRRSRLPLRRGLCLTGCGVSRRSRPRVPRMSAPLREEGLPVQRWRSCGPSIPSWET